MNKLFLLVISLWTLLFSGNKENEITIHGIVKNSGQEYVTLNYQPRFRGALSFDGYHTAGAETDNKGQFSLKTGNITDGAEYYLDFDKKIIRLVLFPDDRLRIEADLKNLAESIFVTGKGAGKINVLHLPQFDYKLIDTNLNLNEFVTKNESTITTRLALLEAIYKKQPDADIIADAPNRAKLLRIIKDTPLSRKEYEWLKADTEIQRYLISDYISATSAVEDYGNAIINPDSALFSAFKEEGYRNIQNINHFHFGNAVDQILKFEYIKVKLKENPHLIFKEWNTALQDRQYSKWAEAYLKSRFQPDVHDKYYADVTSWLMTIGDFDEQSYQYLKDNATDKKYQQCIDAFKKQLDVGLNDPKYNLGSKAQELDKAGFDALTEQYKGKNVLFVFWSAQFAGSSVVQSLPVINYLQKKYGLEIVNICIDKSQYKKLWAARIINSQWKGRHFFMPTETNASTLDAFGAKNIASFCSGGATYTLLSKSGKIHGNISRPTVLTKDKLAEFVE
jgi:hypothetical protein